MTTLLVPAPDSDAENTVVPDELDDRDTVSPPTGALTGLPAESRACTVIGPSDAVDDAAPDTAAEVITNCDADPAVMVAVWVALVNPLPAAVRVGVPALVSP